MHTPAKPPYLVSVKRCTIRLARGATSSQEVVQFRAMRATAFPLSVAMPHARGAVLFTGSGVHRAAGRCCAGGTLDTPYNTPTTCASGSVKWDQQHPTIHL